MHVKVTCFQIVSFAFFFKLILDLDTKRLEKHIYLFIGVNNVWMQEAVERTNCRAIGEAYVQQWTAIS